MSICTCTSCGFAHELPCSMAKMRQAIIILNEKLDRQVDELEQLEALVITKDAEMVRVAEMVRDFFDDGIDALANIRERFCTEVGLNTWLDPRHKNSLFDLNKDPS